MGDDVIIDSDGKPRCAWAGAADTPLARYHDEVWGARTYDESALFEALTLGVFQAGLSWRVVFSKQEAFRTAFRRFAPALVATMTEQEVEGLLEDPSIVSHPDEVLGLIARAASGAPVAS